MPIDSSIALGIRPVNFQQQDPLEQYSKSLALKSLMNKGQMEDSAIADDAAVRAAYQQAGGDNTRLRGLLQGGGQFKAIQALDKFDLERRKDEAEIGSKLQSTAKSKYDEHIDRLQRGAALFTLAKDQQSYDSIIRQGIVSGIFDKSVVEHFPKQFSPEAVQQLQTAGLTKAQQLTDQRAKESQAETGRHNVQSERTSQQQATTAAERLAFERDQPRGTYDPERGMIVDPRTATARPVTMDGGAPIPAKLGEHQKKEIASIDAQKSVLKGAIEAVSATPSAFSMERGAATMAGGIPESLRGRLDSDEQKQARAYVFNVVSKVINERAGAAQSAQELARLRSFLPAETDNAEQIKSKLGGFGKYLDDLRKGYAGGQGQQPAQPAAPSVQRTFDSPPDPAQHKGGFMRGPAGEIYKSDGKNWRRES